MPTCISQERGIMDFNDPESDFLFPELSVEDIVNMHDRSADASLYNQKKEAI